MLSGTGATRALADAGIYVPSLAREIVTAKAPHVYPQFKGFAVGDGCLGTETGVCGHSYGPWWHLIFLYGHGQISSLLYESIVATCGMAHLKDSKANPSPTPECDANLGKVATEAREWDPNPLPLSLLCAAAKGRAFESHPRRIITQGDWADEMFLIFRGVVKLVELSEQEGRSIYLKDGDYFGEIAVLTGGKRMMSVRAVTYCHLYSLQQKLLEKILQQYPECVNNLVMNMMDTYDNFDEIKTQIFALADQDAARGAM